MKLPQLVLDAVVYIGRKLGKHHETPPDIYIDAAKNADEYLWKMHRQMGEEALATMTRNTDDCDEAEWETIKPRELN